MKTQRIKKITVKTSKETGYFYLEANKVKKAIDALIDAHEALERRVGNIQDQINGHFVGEEWIKRHPKPLKPQECECKEPIEVITVDTNKKGKIIKTHIVCSICNKPIQSLKAFCECKKPDYSRIMGNYCERCHRETKPLKPQNTEVLRKKIKNIILDRFNSVTSVQEAYEISDAILRLVKDKI